MTDQERIVWLEETLEIILYNVTSDLGGRVIVVHDEHAVGIDAFVKDALAVSREE
jgi:hypothetical protein